MRIIVCCEMSGVIRRAFAAKGHEVYSCDLLPAMDASPFHIQGCVKDVLSHDLKWDLVIAHPPCNDLSWANHKHLQIKKADGRVTKAQDFFSYFLQLDVPHVCVENVRGEAFRIRKPDQTVQPYHFGHPYTKTTCLWLKNLPRLTPTSLVKPAMGQWTDNVRSKKLRALTFEGIAQAMAEQWTERALSRQGTLFDTNLSLLTNNC